MHIIIDTETTGLNDPDVLEVAVIDAATGRTLVNTRVATKLPIEPGAAAVHGIDAADLVDAPTWDQVLPRLCRATKGRTILAYCADFDAGAIAATTARQPHLQAQHMADPSSWECLMDAAQDRWRLLRPERLNGGHAALSDCHAARLANRCFTLEATEKAPVVVHVWAGRAQGSLESVHQVGNVGRYLPEAQGTQGLSRKPAMS